MGQNEEHPDAAFELPRTFELRVGNAGRFLLSALLAKLQKPVSTQLTSI